MQSCSNGDSGDIVALRFQDGVDFGLEFQPSARFYIPSPLEGTEYTAWLTEHFRNFIRSLSNHPSNAFEAARFHFFQRLEEGTVDTIYIEGNWFRAANLFVYEANNSAKWKGIWMHNPVGGAASVNALYAFAELFEIFLRRSNLPHKRYGRRIGSVEECRQISDVQ